MRREGGGQGREGGGQVSGEGVRRAGKWGGREVGW